MNTMKKNGGFTLVELIIVIAILAILSTGAIAGYSAYIQKANDAAVEAVLSDISTAAVLANAEAGGITSIKIEEVTVNDKTKELKVTITAAKIDDSFPSLFQKSVGASADSDKVANTYTCTIKVPNSWDNSAYGTKNGAYWDGAAWNEGTTAPTTVPTTTAAPTPTPEA